MAPYGLSSCIETTGFGTPIRETPSNWGKRKYVEVFVILWVMRYWCKCVRIVELCCVGHCLLELDGAESPYCINIIFYLDLL